MLDQFLPASYRRYLAQRVRDAVAPELPDPVFFPYKADQRAYVIPETEPDTTDPAQEAEDDDPFATPPAELLGGYGKKRAGHLASGLKDMRVLRDLTAEHELPLEETERILDFGCATGRLIRTLADLADNLEIWGTDIDANRITWCQQNLSPPFHFATTTTDPHLPFEDRYFGFIYAGSVFTHIDDLADAWLMELRRILRLKGRMYITIHDQDTVAAIQGDFKDHDFSKWLQEYPEYEQFSKTKFGKFTIERALHSQVFYSLDYLKQRCEPFFRFVAVKPRAYGMQTAVLLERVR